MVFQVLTNFKFQTDLKDTLRFSEVNYTFLVFLVCGNSN